MKSKFSYSLLIGFLFSISLLLTSCVTPKQLSYFQEDGLDENNIRVDSLFASANNVAIKEGLILTIRVNSITPPGVATPGSTTANPFEPILIPGQPINPPNTTGYLVDEEGKLALPLIGVVQASGQTTAQLASLIRSKLQPYLKEPTVTVTFTTRISILGEVNRPGVFVLNNPAITLPEALGLAGDLTTYAQRENILVIRYINESGKPSHQRLDLTKISVLKSPYYVLRSGDVVYVSPGKARAASVDRSYQIVPILLSSLTVIATVLGLALR